VSQPTWRVLVGDVRKQLASLSDASVQCCVTSPPYWGLRDYGMPGQIGLEPTPEAFVASLVEVFREVRRVLKDDGVCWLNLGDSYVGAANSGGVNRNDGGPAVRVVGMNAKRGDGLKPKDLVGIPWRVAFALQADGWYLRSDVIWSKPNPMPESVTDRPTKAHEYIFLLAKSERYFYDQGAIREIGTEEPHIRPASRMGSKAIVGLKSASPNMDRVLDGTRNARSVWIIATQPYPDAHFATFPEAIPDRCIKAGSRIGDTVLDPFTGSGTTGQVAIQCGRSFIGIELNPAYAELARTRIGGAAPLFSTEVA
jgi:DNA modification methylase